jgi:hypothetical protein
MRMLCCVVTSDREMVCCVVTSDREMVCRGVLRMVQLHPVCRHIPSLLLQVLVCAWLLFVCHMCGVDGVDAMA